MDYKTYAVDDAPSGAKELLAAAKKNYGFVPNLLGTMAEAPSLLKGYMSLAGIFEESTLNPAERQVVLLAVSRENGCEYCVAAHTVIAGMQKVPADVVAAVRSGGPIADRKLEALRAFAAVLAGSRGGPSEAQTEAFLSAGYEKRQVLEVVLGVGLKTLSNYTNHIAGTELDAAFAKAAIDAPGGNMSKKKISCADVVPGCSFTAEAANEKELLQKVAAHAGADHGLKDVPPEVLAKLKGAIKDA